MSAETTLPLTGGCGCGRVRFEVSAPPLSAAYCHCTRCQRRTGTAASPNARVEPGSVRVVAGEQELRSWVPEGGLPKAFCAGCGSALFALSADDGSIVSVRLGAFDGDPGVRPSAHQFVAYAASWEQIPEDGLPRHPEARPS
ncbi:MAG: GFA family protein [Thermoleophilaceae bacterium]|nr:GFA family protein [Thermoleophilaceae bacterium]